MLEVEHDDSDKAPERPTVVRNATDLQRLKLEKLMKNPEKPILIAEKPKERGMPAVPEFVRNVMGSSAGAGSGEFHVYRHLRRKEYARQKFMKERGERERLEDEYHQKLEDNKRKAEEKTAKRRAKRLKRKGKLKGKKKTSNADQNSSESEEESGSDNEMELGDGEHQSEVKREESKDEVENDGTKDDLDNDDGQNEDKNETKRGLENETSKTEVKEKDLEKSVKQEEEVESSPNENI